MCLPSSNLYIFVAGAENLFTGKTLALGAFLRAVVYYLLALGI